MIRRLQQLPPPAQVPGPQQGNTTGGGTLPRLSCRIAGGRQACYYRVYLQQGEH